MRMFRLDYNGLTEVDFDGKPLDPKRDDCAFPSEQPKPEPGSTPVAPGLSPDESARWREAKREAEIQAIQARERSSEVPAQPATRRRTLPRLNNEGLLKLGSTMDEAALAAGIHDDDLAPAYALNIVTDIQARRIMDGSDIEPISFDDALKVAESLLRYTREAIRLAQNRSVQAFPSRI